MSNVLITGGAGFIGSHLAERFLGGGDRVVVLDNFDSFYDPAIKRDNLRSIEGSGEFTLIEGDIRNRADVDRAFGVVKPDSVVHLAARAGVRPSIQDPVLYASVNLDGTMEILEGCRRHGVETLLFASSSSVYGNNDKLPFAEADPVDHPISPYAATKKAGELLCHTYHHLFGLKVGCLRFFTVYGPRQRPEMAIHKFFRLLSSGQTVEQFGDGNSARDYTFVDDIVDGILLALRGCRSYHVWNLGGSQSIGLRELLEKIAACLGSPLRLEQLPDQPGDVQRTWADTERARTELGWEPQTRIDEGLEKFKNWHAAQQRRTRSREGS